ncbi:hypothetical protein KUCAC02_022934 [Chaenocephalus aceratus]|uniref:Uncharacterized protein n=1 Tax=Chaenocephalus aceratus TaxID=36190 RepID=A0ACB9XQQ0_CHAAC|nr:hypothetical protein KUCAC02_022934 [Chaenocephalus aceratus]
MDAATLTYDTLRFGEFEDFPETSEPVWILGKEYNALTEKDDILSDVHLPTVVHIQKKLPANWGDRTNI